MGAITQIGNTFVCTSCVSGLVTRRNVHVKQLVWLAPTLDKTSGVNLMNHSGASVCTMLPEVSGETQVMNIEGWKNGLYLEHMAGGTFYIYCD